MNKEILRQKYLKERMALSKRECFKRSVNISVLLAMSYDLSKYENVHIFLPIKKYNEVNTWGIINEYLDVHPHINFILPKVVGQQLKHYQFEDRNQLKTNKWGISEPYVGTEIPVEAIDMILVPLIVADHEGHRIGYGKGYYDRFLSQCREDAPKVGLSLLPLCKEKIDAEEHDVKLDKCLVALGYL